MTDIANSLLSFNMGNAETKEEEEDATGSATPWTGGQLRTSWEQTEVRETAPHLSEWSSLRWLMECLSCVIIGTEHLLGQCSCMSPVLPNSVLLWPLTKAGHTFFPSAPVVNLDIA